MLLEELYTQDTSSKHVLFAQLLFLFIYYNPPLFKIREEKRARICLILCILTLIICLALIFHLRLAFVVVDNRLYYLEISISNY